jgi:hypothetical protein
MNLWKAHLHGGFLHNKVALGQRSNHQNHCGYRAVELCDGVPIKKAPQGGRVGQSNDVSHWFWGFDFLILDHFSKCMILHFLKGALCFVFMLHYFYQWHFRINQHFLHLWTVKHHVCQPWVFCQ